ncbi:MAG: dTDP-4-dehydrorhamnose 3,5-epimerase family protein [Myxococcales bacterium]|nr:dTDP-4-dehydrorhamnose 3,5-epimerase family protein [Myxococcales bacterium]
MKLVHVKSLVIPEVKVLRFARFRDARGYFTETYRRSDFQNHPDLRCFDGVDFVQVNESYSRRGTVRGLHFQWSPYVGKLVRTVHGRMIDLVLDIRHGSPTCGKILAYDIPASPDRDEAEWIWVPPGFAHGNFFPQETLIEYFCSGHYSPTTEAGICPLSEDIDWSLCERETPELRPLFLQLTGQLPAQPSVEGPFLSDKDRAGFSVAGWLADPRSQVFAYSSAP